MATDILKIENLCKTFGTHKALTNLNLTVPEHAIYGFLGQNGAGKTTTMKMVLGLLKPTSGTIMVCGQPVLFGETLTNRQIGFLPDVPEFYGYMKPIEYLTLCGTISHCKKQHLSERIDELLALVGLEKSNRRISGFSRGMKQRLGIATALLGEPQLLLCDEPTSALDPIGRKEILDILLSIRGKTTILFSTHILSDVERICDHIAVLNNGAVSLSGTLSEIKGRRKSDTLYIEFGTEEEKMRFKSSGINHILQTISETACTLTIKVTDLSVTQEAIFHSLLTLKVFPIKLEIQEPTLESLFMEVVA